MNIQNFDASQAKPISGNGFGVSEKKVDPTRSLLFGKIGRTWTGFFSDWAATFFGSSELKGKGFFQRWSILAHAPITLKSVKSGHDHAYYFVSKLVEKLNVFAKSISDMDLNEYQYSQFDNLSAKNNFSNELKSFELADLDSFIKKMDRFEKKLNEIPEKKNDPMAELFNRMTKFIEESEFNPENRKDQKFFAKSSLERTQQKLFENTCQRIGLFTQELSVIEEGQEIDVEKVKKLQEEILDGMDTYEKLGLQRAAIAVQAIQKAAKKWKALAPKKKAEQTIKLTHAVLVIQKAIKKWKTLPEKARAERRAKLMGELPPRPFLSAIATKKKTEGGEASLVKDSSTPVKAEETKKAPSKSAPLSFAEQIQAGQAAVQKKSAEKAKQDQLLKDLEVAAKAAENPDFSKDTSDLVEKAEALQPVQGGTTVKMNPNDLLGSLKAVKLKKVVTDVDKKEKPQAPKGGLLSELAAAFDKRRPHLKDEDSDTASENSDW